MIRAIPGLLALFLVTPETVAAPDCRVQPPVTLQQSRSAACLVVEQDRVLLVRDRLSGRIGLPGGRADALEAAQCAAHRETWEETGYAVEVMSLLHADRSANHHLYACRRLGGQAPAESIPRPPRAAIEIIGIHWINPHEVAPEDWRFAHERPLILRWFDALRDPGAESAAVPPP